MSRRFDPISLAYPPSEDEVLLQSPKSFDDFKSLKYRLEFSENMKLELFRRCEELETDLQMYKMHNLRLNEGQAQMERDFMNQINNMARKLRHTVYYYENKLSSQGTLIATLSNEIRRLSDLSGIPSLDTANAASYDCDKSDADVLNSIHSNSSYVMMGELQSNVTPDNQNVEGIKLLAARVPLLESQLNEAQQSIVKLRAENTKLSSHMLMDSSLGWLETQVCGTSLKNEAGSPRAAGK